MKTVRLTRTEVDAAGATFAGSDGRKYRTQNQGLMALPKTTLSPTGLDSLCKHVGYVNSDSKDK